MRSGKLQNLVLDVEASLLVISFLRVVGIQLKFGVVVSVGQRVRAILVSFRLRVKLILNYSNSSLRGASRELLRQRLIWSSITHRILIPQDGTSQYQLLIVQN
jgi:hypothetical protein